MTLAVVALISLIILFALALRTLIIHVERSRPIVSKPSPRITRVGIMAARARRRKNKQ